MEKEPIMKKVVIVLNTAWNIYNFRLNLARALKQDGYEVIMVAPYDEKYTKLIEKEFEFYDVYIDSKGMNILSDFKTILHFYKIYKNIKPDIILNFTIKPNIYSSLVAGILGIKSISNITGLGTIFIKQSLVTKVAKLLYKTALKCNDKVLFQNSDDKELFIKNNLVTTKKVDLVPGSGVDLSKFIPVDRNIINENFKFLLIARLLKDKGILEFIEAIKIIKKQYQNIGFQVLGELGVANLTAITKQELQEWIETDLINYLGTSDSVQNIISDSDCVVLPSYREGMPRTLLEACAMEKPIITTNVVGCKDVVEDGVNGFLCKVRDSEDLALKMTQMIELSEDERTTMGQRGREKIIKEFDENIVINKYIEVIRESLFTSF